MLKIKNLTTIALLSTIICILAPLSIQIGAVPITLATFIMALFSILFDYKIIFFSIFIYIILGIIGLPVFANYKSGADILTSPTSGFIMAYIPFGLIISVGSKKNIFIKSISIIFANLLLYFLGCLYFTFITKNNLTVAFYICVVPFILIDIIKMVLAVLMAKQLKKYLVRK